MKKMPFFSKSHKNPTEIVKALKDNMAILEKQEKKPDKVWAKAKMLLESIYIPRPKSNIKAWWGIPKWSVMCT